MSSSNIDTVKRNSFLFAIYITQTNISSLIYSFISIDNLSVIIMGIIILCFFINNKKTTFQSCKIIAYCSVLVLFLISFIRFDNEYLRKYFLNFLIFGTPALLMSEVEIQQRLTLKYMLYIYFIYLVNYFIFLRSGILTSSNYWNVQMGYSYSMVPALLVSIIHLLMYKSDLSKVDFIMSIILTILSFIAIFSDFSTRGAVVSVILGCMLLLLTKLTDTGKIYIVLVSTGCLIFIFLKLDKILNYLINAFPQTKISALNKMISMINRGDFSNGRESLYKNAIEFFCNKPIVGNGIGYFETYNQGLYVHNIFLEAIVEFGVIGAIIVLFLIGKFVINIVLHENKDYLCILLFSSTILLLLFSNSYWLVPCFWLYFFYITNRKLIIE